MIIVKERDGTTNRASVLLNTLTGSKLAHSLLPFEILSVLENREVAVREEQYVIWGCEGDAIASASVKRYFEWEFGGREGKEGRWRGETAIGGRRENEVQRR